MTPKFTCLALTTVQTSRCIFSPNYQTVPFNYLADISNLPIILYKPALLHVFHFS